MLSSLVRLPLSVTGRQAVVVSPFLLDPSGTSLLRLSSSTSAPQAMGETPKPKSGPKSSAPSCPKDEAYLQKVIPKRISLFEEIKAQQIAEREQIGGERIKITLPDGSVKEGKKWLSTPLDIAKDISKSLAANAVISQVNGILWDMAGPLGVDCELKLFTFETDEGHDTFWHSSAHILGESLEQQYGCKLCIGPCTTRGEGFYYDAFYGGLGLNEDHFKQIESAAMKAVAVREAQLAQYNYILVVGEEEANTGQALSHNSFLS
ncbi:threonine--tRNA ligase, mitochondrial 1-like [Macadamia integrifolia]|uniref:threonine--tRNA ligase, mitochondrial 1-like n=1 Tax=Macadamia integrifolia TaxID=60698 RepID=UPI001C4E4656|nr:threonine--tRNA ligase, mitochondrial 1-like [Macadamia integrifolia]XP_042515089.1 threonine--tRNA ligase, mitochondrial 1-like [Macadamia integrifolia]